MNRINKTDSAIRLIHSKVLPEDQAQLPEGKYLVKYAFLNYLCPLNPA